MSDSQKTRILLLSASPKGTSQLRLDEEMREIKEGLKRSKQREQYAIYTAEAVRPRDIHRAILEYDPNIVHFSGHGAGEEGLVFEDETGQTKLVEADALARLFELFAEQIECVVLNACYSEVQAKAIAEHIPYVVGMNKAIGDKAAIEFAMGFYDGLGAGRSVEFAYKLGCNSIEIAGIPEHLTPKLLSKAEERTPINQGSAQPNIVQEHKGTGDNVAGSKTVNNYYSSAQNQAGKTNNGNAEAIELWKEKLAAYRREEAIASDPEKKFQLKALIRECLGKLEELGG